MTISRVGLEGLSRLEEVSDMDIGRLTILWLPLDAETQQPIGAEAVAVQKVVAKEYAEDAIRTGLGIIEISAGNRRLEATEECG